MDRSLALSLLLAPLTLALACCGSEDRVSSPSAPVGDDEIVEIASMVAVDDVADATHALRARAEELGGRIESSDRTGASARLRLRIPSTSIDAMRLALDGLDAERTENESRLDASRTRADVGARLRSARATEERLLALLSERTASLADVLAAEAELARVRSVIEQTESEERTLVDRIDYATLDVTITHRSPAWREEPLAATGRALHGGVAAAWTILVGLLVVTAALSPALAMLTALAMLSRALYRRLA